MSVRAASLHIPDEEHLARCECLRQHLVESNLSGVALFDRYYVLYYAGFAFIPTERPIAFVMNTDGESGLFVPRLELEHAQANGIADRVEHYLEYPGDPHPMDHLKKLLSDLGIAGTIGADDDGYPWILGYRGPALSALANATVVNVRTFIEDQMMVKSEAEVNLIRESVRWGNMAHMLLQRYTTVGATETEVSQRASDEATRAMLDAIGPVYRAQAWKGGAGASAGYRGQIGRNSTIPHALANNIVFQPGDVLVTGAGATVWGYESELERTMFMGEPDADQRRFYDHMMALQATAFEAIQPDVTCSEVDQQVRAYFDKHDLMPYWKHHTGHAIGLRYHEGPFLDTGDDTIIQAGMVFTIEPGLYVPDVGGFRHSDTVLVTQDGIELLTYYPRDLPSMVIPL